jgi:YD repeat-containing protein
MQSRLEALRPMVVNNWRKNMCAALWTVAFAGVFPTAAGAGVNPKTGGFYISYRDLHMPDQGGLVLSVERTYNSMSSFDRGWFGNGWGTLFETRLWTLPEGVVVVQENGSGSSAFYRPAASVKDLDAAVDQLVAASERQKEGIPADALRQQLRSSEDARFRATKRLNTATDIAVGTVLKGERCAEELVRRTSDGFERARCDRALDRFDAAGRLVSREHVSGAALMAEYAPGQSRPSMLRHSAGGAITLGWNGQGQVAQASLGDKVTSYTYSPEGDLIKTSEKVGGTDGMWYRYEYDGDHNLTAIRYLDGTALLLKYDDLGRVVEETSRVGDVTRYAYEGGQTQAGRRVTRITRTDTQGQTSQSEVVYDIAVDESGTDRTTYIGQSSGRGTRGHAMDEKGRVVLRTEPDGSQTQLVYHPHTGKLIIALRGDTATSYHYHSTGELARAEDSTGRVVELDYDAQGHIRHMTEHVPGEKSKRFRMDYGPRGKVSSIELQGVGRVHVIYDEQGEIASVQSKGGLRVRAAITRTFFHLLKMVKDAQ